MFVRFVRKVDSFSRESSLKTWLYRITVNAAMDFHRKTASLRKYETAFVQEVRYVGNPVPLPDTNDSAAEIYRAVNRLPDKQKSAVLLVFGEGLSHREAALVLKCSEKTVSWRIFTARKRLRKLLDE